MKSLKHYSERKLNETWGREGRGGGRRKGEAYMLINRIKSRVRVMGRFELSRHAFLYLQVLVGAQQHCIDKKEKTKKKKEDVFIGSSFFFSKLYFFFFHNSGHDRCDACPAPSQRLHTR